MAGQMVSALSLGTVTPTNDFYIVQPPQGALGSHRLLASQVFAIITRNTTDGGISFDSVTAPSSSGLSLAKLYYNTIDGFRISKEGGPYQNFVLTVDNQTLSNKTLLSPTINNFTNAQHDHSDAATGGLVNISAFSGVLAIANGGTGISTAPTDGQLLIGKTGTGYVLGTLGAASPLSISVSPGSATLSFTGILSPTLGGTGLNAGAAGNGVLLIGTGSGFNLSALTVTPSTNISVTNGSGTITIAGSTTPIISSFANVAGSAILSSSNGGTSVALAPTAITDGMLFIGANAIDAFIPATLTAGANVTITNGAGSITIAAATGGSTTIAIGGTVTSGTVGSVLFVGAGAVLQQDNGNLFWDDTTNRLGLGTASPAAQLHAEIQDTATTTATTQVLLRHNSTGTPAAGFGSQITFALQDSTTANQVCAVLTAQWSVATHGSQTGGLRVLTVTNGVSSTEVARFGANGMQVGGASIVTPTILFNSAGFTLAQIVQPGTNGLIQFLDQLGTGWGSLILGPASTSGLRITNGLSATAIWIRTGDDSGWRGVSCGSTDNVTNGVALGLAVIHETPGTPTTFFGTGITFQGTSTTTLNNVMGSYRIYWTDATHATRSAQVGIAVVQNAATENFAALFDRSATAGDTGLSVWDATAGSVVRVTRGAVDSGGVGFRLLRIPN